jgi:hypothetical protein
VEQDGVTDQASVEHCQFAQADHMKCKTDKIRAAWAGGDKIGALRIAARFFVGIPMKKSTRSDAWRPPVPIDDDQMAWVHGDTVGCIC